MAEWTQMCLLYRLQITQTYWYRQKKLETTNEKDLANIQYQYQYVMALPSHSQEYTQHVIAKWARGGQR